MDRRQFMLSAVSASVAVAAPAAVKAVTASAAPAPVAAPAAVAIPGMWQDLARTIPVTAVGQPVAVWDATPWSGSQSNPLVQPDPARRPTYMRGKAGRDCVQFDAGKDMYYAAKPLPEPFSKSSTAAQIFEVRTSADTSRDALLRNEDEMMRKWGLKT